MSEKPLTPSPTAQPYSWLPGTPEGDALARFRDHTATPDDLITIGLAECHQAIEALPPHAVAPRANNMGGVFSADPSHASACAMRARAMLLRLRERMGQATAPSSSSWETECRRAWSERDDARREVRALRERTGADVVWSDTVRESADGAERIAIFGCYGYGSQGALHWVSLPNDLKIRSPNGMGAQEILAKYPRAVRGGHRTEHGTVDYRALLAALVGALDGCYAVEQGSSAVKVAWLNASTALGKFDGRAGLEPARHATEEEMREALAEMRRPGEVDRRRRAAGGLLPRLSPASPAEPPVRLDERGDPLAGADAYRAGVLAGEARERARAASLVREWVAGHLCEEPRRIANAIEEPPARAGAPASCPGEERRRYCDCCGEEEGGSVAGVAVEVCRNCLAGADYALSRAAEVLALGRAFLHAWGESPAAEEPPAAVLDAAAAFRSALGDPPLPPPPPLLLAEAAVLLRRAAGFLYSAAPDSDYGELHDLVVAWLARLRAERGICPAAAPPRIPGAADDSAAGRELRWRRREEQLLGIIRRRDLLSAAGAPREEGLARVLLAVLGNARSGQADAVKLANVARFAEEAEGAAREALADAGRRGPR